MNISVVPSLSARSDFVERLNRALETANHKITRRLLIDVMNLNPNAIIELSNDDWMKDPSVQLPAAVLLGLRPLDYKRTLTSPLRLAAAYGYPDSLQCLLEHGADPNLIVGGKAALHEASEHINTDCAELLLEHGADPDLPTVDGLSPLHLCSAPQSLSCAKILVQFGAKVNILTDKDGETPLHVASQKALLDHVKLYLCHGADVNHRSFSGETPLGKACGSAENPEDRMQVCCVLLSCGADVNLVNKERCSPLHKATHNLQQGLVGLLLQHHVDVNAVDDCGRLPLSRALQSAAVRTKEQSHLVVQMLLNHGSIKVHHQGLLKVLSACASEPKTVEVLFNSYSRVPVTYRWKETFPDEAVQMHSQFYHSLFSLESRPRTLQHLCRGVIRQSFGNKCHVLISQLLIPDHLQHFLLLEPEGIIY